ncbi:serine protease [Paenibacillus aquistagni]|uniref:serine protease n=1 Tax=Paenibacillus aquistagni TaxID=1852522 RepID=UPI000B4FFDA2|nr:serine protease [Paenibacillus aquistagni]NMM55096.1 serine protease [Paenibacillus aquistagni]
MQGKTSKMLAMTIALMLLAEPAVSQAMARNTTAANPSAVEQKETNSAKEQAESQSQSPNDASSSTAETDTEWRKQLESLKSDPEMKKLHAEMKELRSQMRTLHEKKVKLIAAKLGISTEGKTIEQIRQELSCKTEGKIGMFHEKHVGSKEERMERLKRFAEKQGISTNGLTEDEIKAKLKEWRQQKSE